MYPSGSWRGYWDQAGYGRQSMHSLSLRFHDGQIDGEGADVVGRFDFSGTYAENGAVTLLKHYRYHDVDYQGTYDGEGTIFGQWTIDEYFRGQFALTPERSKAASAGKAIQEIVPESDQSHGTK